MNAPDAMPRRVNGYFATLADLPLQAEITDDAGRPVTLAAFYELACGKVRATHEAGKKIMFVGNGGSASIASHMANDFTKNGEMRALTFLDGSALTCLGNDLGYENVFAKPVQMFAFSGDLLIAISSSGNSANIVNACRAARERDCGIITLSGFKPDNKLRRLGDLNLWLPNGEYGFVEIVHLAVCHAILDLAMGWQPATAALPTDRDPT